VAENGVGVLVQVVKTTTLGIPVACDGRFRLQGFVETLYGFTFMPDHVEAVALVVPSFGIAGVACNSRIVAAYRFLVAPSFEYVAALRAVEHAGLGGVRLKGLVVALKAFFVTPQSVKAATLAKPGSGVPGVNEYGFVIATHSLIVASKGVKTDSFVRPGACVGGVKYQYLLTTPNRFFVVASEM
jgi:hypothetical protein